MSRKTKNDSPTIYDYGWYVNDGNLMIALPDGYTILYDG